MKDFVAFITRALVEHPKDVIVTEVAGKQTTILEMRCHPKDVGRLIGRSGKTVAAIRTLLSNYAAQKGCRAILEVAE
ncbi:MAG: KH domain-containing protein [bacterium]